MNDRRRRLLLALYPRQWRRCHGSELEQFLSDRNAHRRGLRPRDSIGLIVNALVARTTYNPIVACAAAMTVIGIFVALRVVVPALDRASAPTPTALINQLIIEPSASGQTLAAGVRKLDPKTGRAVGPIRWSHRASVRSNTAPTIARHVHRK